MIMNTITLRDDYQSSLFNLFYYKNQKSYKDLNSLDHTHPHPKIRNKYMHILFITVMSWDLQDEDYSHLREPFMRGFDYYTVKSSFLAGLLWSLRHQNDYDCNKIPAFLALDNSDTSAVSATYISSLIASAQWQLALIKSQHLIDEREDNIFMLTDIPLFFSILCNDGNPP